MIVPDRLAIAKTEMPTHVQLCRSKRLASSTTHSSPAVWDTRRHHGWDV